MIQPVASAVLNSDAWNDPRTWISLVSLCFGTFGICSYYWNRKESRLEALSKILVPLIHAAQHLHEANTKRLAIERLKASFPDPQKTPEAVSRVNEMIEEYGTLVSKAHDEFRLAEADLAARSFRFPDKIARMLRTAKDSLSEFGRLVNEGLFDKADAQFARFKDDYAQITREGRGWRLAAPFEGLARQLARKKRVEPEPDTFGISQREMDRILELVYKRATGQAQNSFAVHPPKKLLQHPEVAASDNVVEELRHSSFVVSFQDGTSYRMSFAATMVFIYNLIFMALQSRDAFRMAKAMNPTEPLQIEVSHQFTIEKIMRPEMVKALLQKIEFATVSSDDLPTHEGQLQATA